MDEKQFHPNFDKMDQLSQAKVPFFFMIDFRMNNVQVYTGNESTEQGLLIDFRNFKSGAESFKKPAKIYWKLFPETKENYKKGFDLVQKNLHAGNSYLVNYTRKTKIETSLSLEQIFYLSKAKYKVCFPEKFVFFSPETFVEITADGRIATHPMKGTIDAEIPDAKEKLRNDTKEKAEHYTVIDLLRNDLSMVADDVTVEKFQRIDYIPTLRKHLLAMSSEISGKLKPEFQNRIGSILKTLLPAGSILGAPKRKTLEIILQAEKYERGYYTGICGWFDGANLDSCVAIRFLEKENGSYYFKSGGGITYQSSLEKEYEEYKNKIYVPIY
ncbi:MAG: aminodeoxychorismate synthase component I [Paludibacteraceae bacterium]